jgi:NADPH2:quinone reductase
MMKAIYIHEPGGPEVLKLTKRETPAPKADEVLIQIKAAGINRPDIMQRMGKYPAPKDAPADIPGLEVAGIVSQAAEGSSFKSGDRVCALLSGGGYAEYVAAPASQCLPIPEGLTFEEAASLPETFFTVWNNIFDIGQFKTGNSVLVHGGSSGIGVAAIQMIKAMGGRVWVTAGTEEKCRACRDLGAEGAINYKKEDFVAEVNTSTQGEGVDIVLDMIGGNYANKNVMLLKTQGRLIMINAMHGRMAEVDLIQVMAKRLVITGSTLRPQSRDYKGKIAKSLTKTIWPLIPSQIKPIVHQVFPLEQAQEAHRLMESSAHIGKIILGI